MLFMEPRVQTVCVWENTTGSVSVRETASYVCDSERPLPPRLGCMSVLTAGNRRVLNVICTKSNGIPLNTSMLRADLSPHKKIKINEIQIIKTDKELNWSTGGRKRKKMCWYFSGTVMLWTAQKRFVSSVFKGNIYSKS